MHKYNLFYFLLLNMHAKGFQLHPHLTAGGIWSNSQIASLNQRLCNLRHIARIDEEPVVC